MKTVADLARIEAYCEAVVGRPAFCAEWYHFVACAQTDLPDAVADLRELREATVEVQITAGEILAVTAWPRKESCPHGNAATYGTSHAWWCDNCWYALVDSLRRLAALVEEAS